MMNLKEIKRRLDIGFMDHKELHEVIDWLIKQAEKMDKVIYVNEKGEPKMSQHDILFSVTEDGRDGVNFQVHGSEIPNIINQKKEVLEVMERLKKALINETYPFTNIKK